MYIPDFLSESIEPKYPMKEANKPIKLFEGNLIIRQSSLEVRGSGKVELSWLPLPRIKFELKSDETERPKLKLKLSEVRSLTNPTFISEAIIKKVHHGETIDYTGNLNGKHANGSAKIDLVKFHVPNFYSYNGEMTRYKTENKKGINSSRLYLHDGDLGVILDTVSNEGDLEKDLNAQNGFALTHVGTFQKTGGASFMIDEAIDILNALYYFFSFIRGAWCGPTLSIGTLKDTVVWEPWDLNQTTSWINVDSNQNWFDRRNPMEIDGSFQSFMNKWRRSATNEKVQMLIQWYVEANQHAGGTEGAIILAHSALDLLSSVLSIKAEKAHQRIRELFIRCGINIKLPRKLNNLFAIYHGNDIPKTLSRLRNELVHPSNGFDPISIAQVSQEAREEALKLGLWSIERSFLHFFDYKGHYYNRIESDFEEIS